MLKLSITLPNNAQINLESEDAVVVDRILGIVLADVTRALLELPPAGGGSVGVAVEQGAPVVTAPAQPAPSQPSPRVEADLPEPEPPVRDTSVDEVQIDNGDGLLDDRAVRPAAERLGSFANSFGIPAVEQTQATPQGAGAATMGAEIRAEAAPEAYRVEPEGLANPVEGTNGMPAVGSHLIPSNLMPAVSEQAFVDFCRAANPLGDMRRVVVAAEGASRYLAMEGVDAEALGNLFDIVGWPRAHNFVQTLRNAARSKFGWLERIPGRAGHYSVTDLGRATALGR